MIVRAERADAGTGDARRGATALHGAGGVRRGAVPPSVFWWAASLDKLRDSKGALRSAPFFVLAAMQVSFYSAELLSPACSQDQIGWRVVLSGALPALSTPATACRKARGPTAWTGATRTACFLRAGGVRIEALSSIADKTRRNVRSVVKETPQEAPLNHLGKLFARKARLQGSSWPVKALFDRTFRLILSRKSKTPFMRLCREGLGFAGRAWLVEDGLARRASARVCRRLGRRRRAADV